jgi:S-methylmethionine-dependent homocysteine/selenocysteine methylase
MESKDNKIVFNVLDFTEYPGPRYKAQGDDSGELFYETKLKELFEEVLKMSKLKGQIYLLEINLDNTAGYASSFLDEAFGNLAYDFTAELVKKHLKLISNQEPDWVDIIMKETIPEWHEKKIKGISRKPDLI